MAMWVPGILRLYASLGYQARKMLKGTVVGALRIGREITGREFSACQMIFHAIAADSLLRARLIGAITVLFIPFLPTFHLPDSSNNSRLISNLESRIIDNMLQIDSRESSYIGCFPELQILSAG
jgi:hypothetical protein